MDPISFHDVSDERLRGNVQECSACTALVLRSNAANHASWHQWQADDVLLIAEQAIDSYVAGRSPGRPPEDKRLSLRPRRD